MILCVLVLTTLFVEAAGLLNIHKMITLRFAFVKFLREPTPISQCQRVFVSCRLK